MTPDLDEMEQRHRKSAGGFCIGCWEACEKRGPAVVRWPCDAAVLIARTRELEAMKDRARLALNMTRATSKNGAPVFAKNLTVKGVLRAVLGEEAPQ